jgi:hypothetical protein
MTILNSATRVDYRLYIAGVLTPCSSVTVSTSAPGTSTAQFSAPAHPILLGLGKTDRLQVAIFYLDSSREDGELQWCLLFEGYLAGQNYISSSSSRELTFFAMSNISVWDNLYLEFIGGKGKGTMGKADKITPDEITMKGNFPRRLFTEQLKNKVFIKRAFDLIGNIFLSTTGRFLDRDIASKAKSKDISGQVERTKSIMRLNRDRQFAQFTGQELLTRYRGLATSELRKLKTDYSDALKISLEYIDDTKATAKQKLLHILDEIDDELIKEELEANVGKRDTLKRTPANTGFFARYFNLTKLEQHFVACPVLEGYPDGDKSKLPSGMFPLLKTSMGKRYMRSLARQTGRKFGQGGNVSSFLSGMFTVMNYQITDIIAPPIYSVDSNGLPKGRYKKGDPNNRIAQHVPMPVAPFALPPTCNAIFPSMIRNWNLATQYSVAPTRLYYERASQGRKLNVKSNKKGYADHGLHVGYPAKVTRHAQDASNIKTSDLEVLVFPEEYYRGPNSLFTQINPLLRDIKKLENAGRIGAVNKLSYEDKTLFEKDPIPADQLAFLEEALLSAKDKGNTSYGLFVKQAQVDYTVARTQSTTFSVSTVFNPNMIAGFTTILFDSFESNCHMVGYVNAITHSLTQGQSLTQVSISHARPLRDMLTGILNQGSQYAMHPAEPLTEIRELFQVEESANYVYGNLLYRDSTDADFNLTASGFADKRKVESEIKEKEQELTFLQNSITTFLEVDENEDVESLKEEVFNIEAQLRVLEEGLQTAIADQQSGSTTSSNNFVLNWKELVDIVAASGASQEDTVTSLNDFIGSQRTTTSKEDRQAAYMKILRGFIRPKKEYEQIFYSLPVSMRFISRPVCTLEQYIDFYKFAPDFISGTSSITGGRGRGVRAGPVYLDSTNSLAKHYTIIREFVGGPGFEPGSKIASNNTEPSENVGPPQVNTLLEYRTAQGEGPIIKKVFSALTEGSTATVQDLPDLAEDSQEIILLYADLISSRGKL